MAQKLMLAGTSVVGNIPMYDTNSGQVTDSLQPLVDLAGLDNNVIINGNMEVFQRGQTFTNPGSGDYTLDRWEILRSDDAAVDVLRTADGPTVAEAGVYLPSCLHCDVTTADGTIGAAQSYAVSQKIEGYVFQQIAQRQFTLGFWHKHTKTGTYCVSFRNDGVDRSYVAEYTQTTTDTWEYSTITVSASPSAGTWNYTNGRGLIVNWALAMGSDFETAPGSWQTGNFRSTSNQVNALDSTSNNFKITGITIVAGANPARYNVRNIAQELEYCQRYTIALPNDSNSGVVGWGYNNSTTLGLFRIPIYNSMRATPTLEATASDFRILHKASALTGVTTLSLSASAKYYVGVNAGVASGLTAGEGSMLMFDVGGGITRFILSAEL